ncbi:hypothetical protein EOI86_01340 [Hwanghaeella grinnelliae]|uniref:Uncharacterized protein n=1 Tax=Hwanghaeella grinnelliae TaxID=2500179 RepID=A0A437QU14_9PROT|nr:hypothetical protein [Hwanghaeella grinnelliae]RVU37979.1 hypothetical protein EOI86_01340 [Hwanghaeella grinnelliae]
MSAIALAEWESFVSRLFKKDLDTNGWFVEIVYADETGANDNELFAGGLGLIDADDDDLAEFDFIWDSRRRRG